MAVNTINLVVEEVRRLTEYVYNVHFKVVPPQKLEFKAGQRCLFAVGVKFNNYSLCSSPADSSRLQICVDTKPGGMGSKWIRSLVAGTGAICKGPLGNFVLTVERVPKIFLATGTGISPIMSMVRNLGEKNFELPVYLFFGVRGEKEIFWQEELGQLVRKLANFRYVITLSSSEASVSEKGYVQDVLLRTLFSKWTAEKITESEYYLCGNGQMIADSRQLLEKFKVGEGKIFCEKFYEKADHSRDTLSL